MLTKTTLVCGQLLTLYSVDGAKWFSSKREAEQSEQRRQKNLRESDKWLKKTGKFLARKLKRMRNLHQ
jgi:hypothetical protein